MQLDHQVPRRNGIGIVNLDLVVSLSTRFGSREGKPQQRDAPEVLTSHGAYCSEHRPCPDSKVAEPRYGATRSRRRWRRALSIITTWKITPPYSRSGNRI